MIQLGTAQLEEMRDVVAEEATFVGALYEILRALPKIQNAWFRSQSASGHRSLSSRTVGMRARRVGYYKREAAAGVLAALPFGVWSGNTLAHTTGIMGRVAVRNAIAEVSHDLDRWWVVSWWDEERIANAAREILERRWARAFDGKRSEQYRNAA